MTTLNKLSAARVKSAPTGKHSDGGGLWLIKRDDGGGQWMLRVTIHGKRREMGLGGIGEVSLKEVREKADKWRSLAKQGIDPIRERDRQKGKAVLNLHNLEDIAKDAFESRKAELKGDGKAGRWYSPLQLHVLPKLGKIPVAEIDQIDIRNALAPIWHEKADTARKAMNRLNICIEHAAALGLDVDMQAVAKAKALLGKQRHVAVNVPFLPWQEVPAFYQSLDNGSITHLALRLLILTAVRLAPIRFMKLKQVDGDVWTIPAEMIKGRKNKTSDFRVPLSNEALAIIEQARPLARDGYLFPSARRGVISDATMSRLMERRKMKARPHGFRSSFRTWVADTTETSFDIAETAMAHTVGNSVQRAYQRSDFLEQRRILMQCWSNHVVSNFDKREI